MASPGAISFSGMTSLQIWMEAEKKSRIRVRRISTFLRKVASHPETTSTATTATFALRIHGLLPNSIMNILSLFVRTVPVCVACLVLGCHTNKAPRSSITPPNDSKVATGLTVHLPRSKTIEELKAYGDPGKGVEEYYTFEHGTSKVFVIVTAWGSGAIRDGVSIYAYDSLTHFWEPVALWDTKVRGVKIEFEKQDGTVRVLSNKGVTIFTLSVPSLAPRETYDW
jgi:hypothetical protein